MERNDDSNAQAPKPSGRRRRKFRLSVRGLLVLGLILGSALGWAADKFRRARQQHEASVAVISRHGTIDYGENFRLECWGKLPLGARPRHVWLREWVGDDLFDTVTNVTFFPRMGSVTPTWHSWRPSPTWKSSTSARPRSPTAGSPTWRE